MPHHFRTIEELVQLLEVHRDAALFLSIKYEYKPVRKAEYAQEAATLEWVLKILRTSNIGIVYPPPDRAGKFNHVKVGFALVECDCSQADKCPQGRIASEGKCRIVRDLADDGQVRGFRVAP